MNMIVSFMIRRYPIETLSLLEAFSLLLILQCILKCYKFKLITSKFFVFAIIFWHLAFVPSQRSKLQNEYLRHFTAASILASNYICRIMDLHLRFKIVNIEDISFNSVFNFIMVAKYLTHIIK